MKISILKIGIGNPKSVQNMLKKIGQNCQLIEDKAELQTTDVLILPGVGHFARAMELLSQKGLIQPIKDYVSNGGTIIGICLGMQLLCSHSEEGDAEGFNFVQASVKHFDHMKKDLIVPNMGWRNATIKNSALEGGYPDDPRFYFTHSYFVDLEHKEDLLIEAHYGNAYCAAFKHNNVYGFQFHPEKSHVFGMQLLKNLIETLDAA